MRFMMIAALILAGCLGETGPIEPICEATTATCPEGLSAFCTAGVPELCEGSGPVQCSDPEGQPLCLESIATDGVRCGYGCYVCDTSGCVPVEEER